MRKVELVVKYVRLFLDCLEVVKVELNRFREGKNMHCSDVVNYCHFSMSSCLN